jgi:hypothetical protein
LVKLLFLISGIGFEVKIRLVPDSVRWLLSRGRLGDAKKVIQRAAKINRTDINDEVMKDWENGQKCRVVKIGNYAPSTKSHFQAMEPIKTIAFWRSINKF